MSTGNANHRRGFVLGGSFARTVFQREVLYIADGGLVVWIGSDNLALVVLKAFAVRVNDQVFWDHR